jgi:oligopeptide transport system ATP-binding protein
VKRMPATNHILAVRNLSTSIRTAQGTVKAVNGVSFAILRGETFGLVGESGCGKSTLALSILRLIEPVAGSVEFEGTELGSLSQAEMTRHRRELQVIFQDPYSSLPPRMAIKEIIEEPLKIFRVGKTADRAQAVTEILAAVGLERLIQGKAFPHQLSGGERQRVAIARALVLKPRLIICDEPVSALDVSIQAQILSLLKDLQKRFSLSYMFISHDLRVIKHMCRRVAVMYLGKIVEVADTSRLFTRPLHPYTKALLSSLPTLAHEPSAGPIALPGELPSPLDIPRGCPFNTRCPFATSVCFQDEPPMLQYNTDHFAACHHVASRACEG